MYYSIINIICKFLKIHKKFKCNKKINKQVLSLYFYINNPHAKFFYISILAVGIHLHNINNIRIIEITVLNYNIFVEITYVFIQKLTA